MWWMPYTACLSLRVAVRTAFSSTFGSFQRNSAGHFKVGRNHLQEFREHSSQMLNSKSDLELSIYRIVLHICNMNLQEVHGWCTVHVWRNKIYTKTSAHAQGMKSTQQEATHAPVAEAVCADIYLRLRIGDGGAESR